jgi:sterol desaturase/sphingolipid hydroxylase (fatty acid hydroxylase superfamily)
MGWYEFARGFVVLSVEIGLVYLIIAGSAHWLVRRNDRWQVHRIRESAPSTSQLRREVAWSMATAAVFAAVVSLLFVLSSWGYGNIYREISSYGWRYLIFSFAIFMLLHDAYFYWTHRVMHRESVFRSVHRVHHQSHNPSPWSALSFHPLEALVHVSFAAVMVMLIPIHRWIFPAFLIVMLVENVIGHSGYEFFPLRARTHRLGRWFNTSAYHNLHHRYSEGNYGLYFTWWDRFMNTFHPDSARLFDRAASGQRT